jgi:CDP-6-deoxy-D-xylo-4-hexulose-3-dehydrase
MQAAIGMQQLKKLGAIIAERQYNFKRLSYIYETYYKYFILPIATNKSNPSWFAFPLTLRENAPFTRDEYVNYLESKNIQTRPYFAGNILLQPGYSDIAKKYGISPKSDFPNATYVTRNTFFHGVSPVINDDQLDYIDDVVTEFMRRY